MAQNTVILPLFRVEKLDQNIDEYTTLIHIINISTNQTAKFAIKLVSRAGDARYVLPTGDRTETGATTQTEYIDHELEPLQSRLLDIDAEAYGLTTIGTGQWGHAQIVDVIGSRTLIAFASIKKGQYREFAVPINSGLPF